MLQFLANNQNIVLADSWLFRMYNAGIVRPSNTPPTPRVLWDEAVPECNRGAAIKHSRGKWKVDSPAHAS